MPSVLVAVKPPVRHHRYMKRKRAKAREQDPSRLIDWLIMNVPVLSAGHVAISTIEYRMATDPGHEWPIERQMIENLERALSLPHLDKMPRLDSILYQNEAEEALGTYVADGFGLFPRVFVIFAASAADFDDLPLSEGMSDLVTFSGEGWYVVRIGRDRWVVSDPFDSEKEAQRSARMLLPFTGNESSFLPEKTVEFIESTAAPSRPHGFKLLANSYIKEFTKLSDPDTLLRIAMEPVYHLACEDPSYLVISAEELIKLAPVPESRKEEARQIINKERDWSKNTAAVARVLAPVKFY